MSKPAIDEMLRRREEESRLIYFSLPLPLPVDAYQNYLKLLPEDSIIIATNCSYYEGATKVLIRSSEFEPVREGVVPPTGYFTTTKYFDEVQLVREDIDSWNLIGAMTKIVKIDYLGDIAKEED